MRPFLGGKPRRFLPPFLPSNRLALVALAVAIYAALFVAMEALRFEPSRDEIHFWPTSLEFSERLVPTIEQLRSYNELSTPLPFVLFGVLEHLFGGGIFAGRLLNLILSFAIVLLIGWGRPNEWRPVLAAVGLLCCPYYLGSSAFLYTDIIAVFFGVVGLWFHRRGWVVSGAVCFALGIASRQYLVALPAALAMYELLRCARTTKRLRLAWIAPGLAASTLLGWIWFFGGPAPPAAVAAQKLATAALFQVYPEHMLYFLTCIGAYFVIPETVLFWRWSKLTALVSARAALIAIVLVGLFLLFPPLNNPADYPISTMGYFDKAARLVLNDPLRMVLFLACALLACVRFKRAGLASWALLFSALVMLKAHIGWDKYALSLLAWLWLLKAAGALDEPGHSPETPTAPDARALRSATAD